MRWVAALLGCAFAMGAVAEQSATPTNPAQVNLFVTVHDKHGKIINDLSQSDFVLEEDGHAQTIRFFEKQTSLPLTLGLVVDTGSNQSAMLDQEQSASGSFINQTIREDKDKAFLIHFDHEVELLQDLTASREKMSSGLRLLQTAQPQLKRAGSNQGNGNDDDNSGDNSGNNSGNSGDNNDHPHGGRGGQGRGQSRGGSVLLYDSVFLASHELMRKQQGRKAIIVLSDGVDRGSKTTLDRAIEAAQRTDTAVYSILIASKEENENQNQPWGQGGGMGRGGMGGGMGGPWGRHGDGYPAGASRYPQEQHPDGKKILERISNETGGRMFEVGKKETLAQIYQQIQDGLRNQYSLSYIPDGGMNASTAFRAIHLTTKKKDAVIEVEKGYYAATQPSGKSDPSAQAAQSKPDVNGHTPNIDP
jgi:VWFA-related protein